MPEDVRRNEQENVQLIKQMFAAFGQGDILQCPSKLKISFQLFYCQHHQTTVCHAKQTQHRGGSLQELTAIGKL